LRSFVGAQSLLQTYVPYTVRALLMENQDVKCDDSALLLSPSLSCSKRARHCRPWSCFQRRQKLSLSMKKLFIITIALAASLLVYYIYRANGLYRYTSYQYNHPRLKSYAACIKTKSNSLANLGSNSTTTAR